MGISVKLQSNLSARRGNLAAPRNSYGNCISGPGFYGCNKVHPKASNFVVLVRARFYLRRPEPSAGHISRTQAKGLGERRLQDGFCQGVRWKAWEYTHAHHCTSSEGICAEDQTLELIAAVGGASLPMDERWRNAAQGCCEWLKANRDVWTTWLPVATDCTEGFGIADVRGMPVTSRAEAVNCQICPAGTFSELYEDGGFTYRCQPCNPGYHQTRAGQISCTPCDLGTHSAEAGQAFCSPCSRGSFMNLSTATSCFPCGPSEAWTTSKALEAGEQERWIEIEGEVE